MQEATSYDSLRHFEFLNPKMKKRDIAARLRVSPSRYSYLRAPEAYRPRLAAGELHRIAKLLNQAPEYVRAIYPKAA